MKTIAYRKVFKNYLIANIYSKMSNGCFYSPFSLSIDDMNRLILINFEKDPDEFYNTFELQQASDKTGKKYLLVVAYRNDGGSDIYYQPGYLFASQASVLNDVTFFARALENAKFEITKGCLDVYFTFNDKYGRRIKVIVNENKKLKNNPFYLLAPVGVVSKKPSSLPIYSLYEMSFTKRKNTNIEIEIDEVKHKPDTFPLPIDYSKNYFTRYSTDAFNVDWNKNFHGQLFPLMPGKKTRLEDNGVAYELVNNNGHYEIKDIRTTNHKHYLNINFFPPLPDIVCLVDDVALNGKFMTTTDKTIGTIRGEYYLKRHGQEIELKIQANKGWIPNENRFILKLLFLIVKVFKDWPKSYIWNATIKLNETDHPVMKSSWSRI
ncbi:MAG: hypothetical protein RBT49_00145 [Bacteroidales bacterium]|jgi:hypothetical protein|nr:hypothetical protein [Bacteroidales bacterium]